ncbi:MAG: hypothetical protein U0R71_11175 [Solirubrobacterales bacterium]
MGLSDDQRAMLRMVAQRGEQGYEDIAALMGLSVEEVRTRVAAALAELDAEGALASGEAAGAPRPELAAEPAPEAPAAAPPPPPSAPSPPPPSSPKQPAGAPRIKLSGTGMRAAIGAAVAIIALVAVILIVTGGDGGEGSEPAGTGAETTAASETAAASEGGGGQSGGGEEPGAGGAAKQLTKAKLTAVDGSAAEGVAIFGRVKKSLALELAVKGLQPTGSKEAYTVWLSKSRQKMLPLASTRAPKGTIGAKFEVPVEVLAYLADETFTDLVVTRTDDAQLTAALKAAAQQKTTPEYTGTEVLRGEVTGPIVGAQFRLEELEKEEQEEK